MTIATALAILSMHAPLPAPLPSIVQQPCPTDSAAMACTNQAIMFLRPDLADQQGQFYFLEAIGHELGHVWADQHPLDLQRFTLMVNARPAAPVSAGERFADTYAFCALGPRRRARFRREVGDLFGTYGEHITRRVIANTCWLIRHPATSRR